MAKPPGPEYCLDSECTGPTRRNPERMERFELEVVRELPDVVGEAGVRVVWVAVRATVAGPVRVYLLVAAANMHIGSRVR